MAALNVKKTATKKLVKKETKSIVKLGTGRGTVKYTKDSFAPMELK